MQERRMADAGLDGKVVIVTGAASGIGRAIATAFAAEGAFVLAADVNALGLDEIAGERIVASPLDVTEADAMTALAHDAVERFGRIDVLFNNAGLGWRKRIDEIPPGDFEQMIAVHLFGAYHGLRAVLPAMRAQGYGRVVNTLSRGAEAQAPGWAAYAAAKAGMLALTRVAAAECAGTDILVNGMIPGPTRTGMMQGDNLQAPEAVVPSARWLASLPAGGPTGKMYWNMKEYRLFAGGFGEG
jgi:3-hydroxybutyrate dehydrogenase